MVTYQPVRIFEQGGIAIGLSVSIYIHEKENEQ
jgi:hypothetical protein